MKSWLFIPLAIFILVSCKSKNKIPSDILSQKKMQAVLWDVMRADQFLADYVLNKDSSLDKVNESIQFYDKIFAMHQVSEEQFQKSFSFYKEHPDLLKVIMDSIGHSPIQAPTQSIVPENLEAPTQVVQPAAKPDTPNVLQKQLDTLALQIRGKKKGVRIH